MRADGTGRGTAARRRNPNHRETGTLEDQVAITATALSPAVLASLTSDGSNEMVWKSDANFCPEAGQDEAVPSFGCDRGEHAAETARSPLASCAECAELQHQLSNAMAGVLVNAQVLQWKLPPYSHLKRLVRQVERNAQRGGELLRRLAQRSASAIREPADGGQIPSGRGLQGRGRALNRQGPPSVVERSNILPRGHQGAESPATAILPGGDLTTRCDAGTSGIFPKRDDGSER